MTLLPRSATPAPPTTGGAFGEARRLMALLVLPVLTLLGVLMVTQYRQQRDHVHEDVVRADAEHARALAALVQPAIDHVRDVSTLMSLMWEAPPDHGPGLREALRPRRLEGRADGFTLDDASSQDRERYGQVLWYDPAGTPPPDHLLRLAHSFVAEARVVHRRAPGFVASWLLPADAAMSVGYPWFPSKTAIDSFGERSLLALAPLRAGGSQERREWVRRNPNVASFWTPPYFDDASAQLTVSHLAPVMVRGEFKAEVLLDFRLSDLQALIAPWGGIEGRYWIINDRGDILADQRQPLTKADKRPTGSGVRVPLTSRLPDGVPPEALDQLRQAPGRLHAHGDWVLVLTPAPGGPWQLVQAIPSASLQQRILPALTPYLILALALVGVFAVAQAMLALRFVSPARQVLLYLRNLAVNPTASRPRVGRTWQPWVQTITETLEAARSANQREAMERALRSSVVDHALAAIVTTDQDGRVVDWNPAAEAMFGHPREQAIGRGVGELIVPPRLRGALQDVMARVREGGEPQLAGRRLEVQALRADGTEFPVEMVVSHVQLEGRTLYSAFIVDTTARVEAAQQIERQREALRQSEKLSAMGSLLAGVAHELNNPLAIVMGRASLLEDKTEGSALQADARRIREAAERCGRIVRTFLNMARQRPAERRHMQLNDLARAAADMLGYTLRSHGVDLQLALAEPLPEVSVDSDQVGQVVLNLLVNAQQALSVRDGERRVRVSTGVDRLPGVPGGTVWLRVADNGPGVPAEARERIFEPFFTTKAEGIGTGLGLAVSRSLAREHGGELSLDEASDLGGASFCLRLPLLQGAGSDDHPPHADPHDHLAARLLVVDDEAEIADLIRSMLESAGYDVSVAESGAVALELIDMARFDAVVSDLRMPDMDGAALWREIKARQPHLARRMLFVTGDTLSPGARQFLGETQCDSLDKPFSKTDLLERVAALLEQPAPATA